MEDFVINTRVLHAPVTGVQRYTKELLARWNGQVERIAPRGALPGGAGHAWEQFVLPGQVKGRLLFSPSNTGPLRVRNQVVTIHDMSVFDCPEGFSPSFGKWCRFLLPRLAKRARFVLADSEFTKRRILAHIAIPPEKIKVVYCGVSASFGPQALSEAQRVIAALKLPSRRYILTVGSLEPRKNLARLLRAWKQVRQRLPEDLWLVVVGGKGSSRVFAHVPVESVPRVFFADRVDDADLSALYAGAFGFAYVSLYEGFGLPPLEAMASGIPVLAGNRSSLPEVVGDAGILVDPENEGEIGEGLCALVENSSLRQDLRERGLARAQQFCWDQTALRTWQILQEAVAG
jgi:glycosyltransferase involved in cell wall biosynthesis